MPKVQNEDFSKIGIEQVQEFWDTRPCNIRHSEKPIGTVEYFNEVEARKYFVEPHIIDFANFDMWKDKSVLEVGCGIGTDAINFARAGARYTGIELSKESLKITKERFKVFDLKAELIEANAENFANYLPNTYFDLVYSFGVLHHTPNINQAITEIRSLCHESTLFKFMVYAKDSWKAKMIEIGLDQPEAQFGCPIANTYSVNEIEEILSSCGFEILSAEQEHIFPYKIEKYINYQYELEPWFAAMPKDMFQALEKKLGWHLLVTARPRK